jgi:zinc protease
MATSPRQDHTLPTPSIVTGPPAARLAPARVVLDNGVVVIAKETRKTPAVTIHLAVHAGSVCDPADATGASYLLSRVIDRGTTRRSAADIAEGLESRGTSITIAVNRHLLSLVCSCLAEDFEPVLEILSDILMAPSIPAPELEIRKREVITAIAQDDDSPYVKAVEELLALLYGPGHPYGRKPKGAADIIGALSRDRLLALHRDHFNPSQLSAVVVGDVSPERVVDVASHLFGGWRAPAPSEIALPSPVVRLVRRRAVIPMPNKAQADIAYGFTAIRRADPDYYAASLMNNILGQYAMGGRLGDSIRERQGMAYYVSSALEANLGEGPLVIRAGVGPANVDRALASIDAELDRIRRDGVTERELTESRQYLVGSMPRALETNHGIANFLQSAEFYGLGLDYDARLSDLLGSVTRDHVHSVAQRLLDPTRATFVIAGPYTDPS